MLFVFILLPCESVNEKDMYEMKGKLISAKASIFNALNIDYTLWTLTIETRFLKRKIKVERNINDDVDVKAKIGMNVEV